MPKVVIHYQDRWAVVTGASSGLGRGLAAGLADRGMSLVLTGRNQARLDETAHQIRRAAPAVKVETVAADLSSRPGVSALLDHVGDRPVEVLVNNAGFGSYGPFAEADPDRETEELAVDVGTVVALARAFLPGMLARGSGGILNVASTIAFQPAPLQAVYGANKAFVLSFSQALWAEARPAGVAVTALCPGPTRTGFVDALGADVGHTAIYRRLADPGPVIKAGLGALDQGRAVVIPGLRNKVIATGGFLRGGSSFGNALIANMVVNVRQGLLDCSETAARDLSSSCQCEYYDAECKHYPTRAGEGQYLNTHC